MSASQVRYNEGNVVPGTTYDRQMDYMDVDRLLDGTTVQIVDDQGHVLWLTTTRHMAGFPYPKDTYAAITGVSVYSSNWPWFNSRFLVQPSMLRVDPQIRVGQEFTFRTGRTNSGCTGKIASFTVQAAGVLAKR